MGNTGIYTVSVSDELSRTERILNNEANYRRIEKFSRDIRLDGLTDFRVMFYITRLRHIAQILQEKFQAPSKDDLKLCIEKLAEKGISPRSVEDYKQTLKKFYFWQLNNREYKKACSWIHVKSNVDRLKKSEEMLSKEEADKIIANCKNIRDKALVSILYDTGCRIGEILTIRIKDLEIDDKGMSVRVTGKTGERIVYVIGDSISYLKQWREAHPDKDNPEATLFIDSVTGEPINYHATRKNLMRAVKRSGIKKRIHIHLFRHSYASRYAEVLSEGVLKAQLGWTGSSRMAQKYVHLSNYQQRNAILKANGLEPEEKTLKGAELKICQRCGEKNPSTSSYCFRCWFPLTTEAALKLQENQNKIEDSLIQKNSISPDVQNILKNIPESEKTVILSAIVKALLDEKQKKDRATVKTI